MDTRSETIRRDLTRGATISYVGNVFKLAEFALTLLAAGLFGVHVWGQYIFLNTLFMPGMRLALAGMDKGVTWYVSRHRASRLPDGFFRWIRLRMLAAGALVLLAAGAWHLAAGDGALKEGGLVDPLSLALMAASVPFLMLTHLNLGLSIAFRKIEHEVLVRGILPPLFQLGFPCALAFFSRDISLLAAFFLAGAVAGWAVSAKLAAPLRREMAANPVTEETPRATAALWNYSWPMGLRDVLLAVQQRADVWCLALFLTPEAIGVYGLALSIANSIRTIRQAFDSILLAVVASLKRGADAGHIRDAYLHAGQATMALQIPIFAFLVFFASHLLGLSGPTYAAGEAPLLIFAFTLILIGYLGLSATVVLGLGKSRWGVWNDVLSVSLTLGLNLYLVPRHGIVGAALGTALAMLITNLVWFLESVYLIRRVPLKPAVFANLLLGLASTGAAWLLWKRYGTPDLPSRALGFGAFALAYGSMLWFLFGKAWLARRRARAAGGAAA